MKDKPFVLWIGAATDPSGYGEATRNYVLGLNKIKGVNLKLQNRSFWHGDKLDLSDVWGTLEALAKVSFPEDMNAVNVMMNLTPEQYFVQKGLKSFTGITTFETDGIPQHWLMQMRAMDHIITYSRFNFETFTEAGVTRPIHIVPHGVDTEKYSPNGPCLDGIKKSIGHRFAFGANFDWTERKNPEGLISAYYNAFTNKDEVILVLKTYNQYPITKSAENIRGWIADIKKGPFSNRNDLPPILLLTDIMKISDMPAFYRSLNAYVLISRGEGWSLTHSEAMSTGLPTVGTNWGGNTEYMTRENSFLIDYEIEKIKDEQVATIPHYRNQSWASAKLDQLTNVMQFIYNNREAAQAKGMKARADMCENWTWDIACKRLNELLVRIL